MFQINISIPRNAAIISLYNRSFTTHINFINITRILVVQAYGGFVDVGE